jgi:hypothetical protein
VSRCGTQFARPTISIDELKEIANGQARQIAMHLLPNGRESCGYWETSNLTDAKTGSYSLKVNISGASRGMWTDFGAPKGTKERAGNILQLIAAVKFGHDIGAACSWARSWLGLDTLDPDRLATEKARARRSADANLAAGAKEAEDKRRRAMHLYLSAEPLPGTIAETYLISRGIDLRAAGLRAPGALKFQPRTYCHELYEGLQATCSKTEARARAKIPAMVAAVVNLEGRHIATHRTYLQPDGSGKALLLEAKKALGKYQGGFIPLWKGEHDCPMGELPEGTPVYVSEGIEDGLSVALARPSLRVIAAISLSNMGSLVLRPDCPIYLLGQRDENMVARDAFHRCVERLQQKGHDVFLILPPEGVKDYNDLLQRDGAKQPRGEQDNGD